MRQVSKCLYTNGMVRPRLASDDEIVERIAAHLASRQWPAASWTLAEVAPAAGLSPAGLVKRFGSRAGLLLALGRSWLAGIPASPEGERPPAEELRAYAAATFGMPSGAAAALGLADLLADLANGEAAAVLREGNARQHRYVAALIAALGLPRAGEPDRAARALLDALQGGLVHRTAGDDEHALSPDALINYFLELWT